MKSLDRKGKKNIVFFESKDKRGKSENNKYFDDEENDQENVT